MVEAKHHNYNLQTNNQIVKFLNQYSVSDLSLNNLSNATGINPTKLNFWLKNWFKYDVNNFNFSSKEFILEDKIDKKKMIPRELKINTYCQYNSFKIDNPTINVGWTNSPFGNCFLLENDASIVGLAFGEIHGLVKTENDMIARLPGCNFVNNQKSIDFLSEKIFYKEDSLNVKLIGTKFQVNVWSNLLKLRVAKLDTYSGLAKKMNIRSSLRAVATAIGRNPVAWLLPCHRVIRQDGGLGGYHWGLPIKSAMLLYEYIKNDPAAHHKAFVKTK